MLSVVLLLSTHNNLSTGTSNISSTCFDVHDTKQRTRMILKTDDEGNDVDSEETSPPSNK
jgi:hypothetical protein